MRILSLAPLARLRLPAVGYAMGMYLEGRQIGRPAAVYGNPMLPDFWCSLNYPKLPVVWVLAPGF